MQFTIRHLVKNKGGDLTDPNNYIERLHWPSWKLKSYNRL